MAQRIKALQLLLSLFDGVKDGLGLGQATLLLFQVGKLVCANGGLIEFFKLIGE